MGSLHTLLPQDKEGNAKVGSNIDLYSSNNCIVHANDAQQVVVEGLNDYIVALHNGRLLICSLKNEQMIKEFAK